MLKATAHVTSERASIYLQQLCKHFAHKIPAEFTPEKGEIRFPFGTCYLAAQGSDLEMRVEAEGAEALAKLQEVVASHLVRFAFKDPPQIVWSA